ncbi:hypothetical protein M404DRAFT_992167 [Pisolithus tinctorius Marx 270]|uniref:Uncharacterized protein n=1 Tax=Pisolithus tinctorius Marx 270 TaxID=870435 RepID=A0A0C3KWN0_PISTI|nr:hypothetical protein M404DRAFT_992167 [Pisolithus tinctorius Marx 270]
MFALSERRRISSTDFSVGTLKGCQNRGAFHLPRAVTSIKVAGQGHKRYPGSTSREWKVIAEEAKAEAQGDAEQQ